MTVAFKELAGSPRETYDSDGMRAERRILVAWEDRHAMIGELLGDGYEFGGSQPAGYPGRAAVAVRAEVVPWPECPDQQGPFDDVATQLNAYSGKYAQIVVRYELLDAAASRADLPSMADNTFLTYRMEIDHEELVLPDDSLRWESDDTIEVPPEAVATVRVPITEHRLTWQRVVNPPWTAIRRCTGTVNDGVFLGATAETLLFDGARAQRQFVGIDALGRPQFAWTLSYTFREKAIKLVQDADDAATYGWNHAYRSLPADDPGWDKLKDTAGNYRYRTADFGQLFQLDASG